MLTAPELLLTARPSKLFWPLPVLFQWQSWNFVFGGSPVMV